MDESSEKIYQIGEVSKICNIPIKTLRYYDEIGLLIPEKVNPESNYRYYSNDQLVLILVIKHFKEAGFSLKEIKTLLTRENLEYNQKMIYDKCTEIDDKINDLLRLKGKLNFLLDEGKKEKKHKSAENIEVRYIEESYVAYLRFKGTCTVEEFTERYCALMSLIEKRNFHTTKNVMAVYYDNCIEFEEKGKTDYEIEVCAPVSFNKEIPGVVRKFGGFKAAVTTNYGSYNTMIDSYRKLNEFIKKNHYEICGPAVDNYLIDIISTSNEDNYVTELFIPIK